MYFRLYLLALASLALTACAGNELTALAEDTCAELEGSIVLTAGPIINRAVSQAERLGYSAPDLGDEMRASCPDLMSALDTIVEDQDRRSNLPNQMVLTTESCSSSGVRGTVKNNSSVTVDIVIDTHYLRDGVIVADGIESVRGVRPGETAEWSDEYYQSASFDRCRATISSVFER